ncbi:MAG: cobalamin biosynthesis protein [Oscillospiraceae bacterium]|jgi:cobalt-precorrin 5A hydrolase|nr:cobalamin biosynthesis protein [Oscillospiraceae bacterium]
MIIRAAAFTDKGASWSGRLGFPVERPASVAAWTEGAFAESDALLFIGAAGVASRAIARHIRDKTTDPAVLVMDELGRHIIPILSGHIGGANRLARSLAARTGAEAVITTATDLNDVPAIDEWAVENGCAIENPEAIRAVSAAALVGRPVGVMITERTLTPPFPVTLTLRPRTLVIGAGCRRDADPDAFERSAMEFLARCGVSALSVRSLASLDIKAAEPAFLRFTAKYRLDFMTYSPKTLAGVEGVFARSEAVLQRVGVDNVCERAAALASGGRLLMGKTIIGGATFALAGDNST